MHTNFLKLLKAGQSLASKYWHACHSFKRSNNAYSFKLYQTFFLKLLAIRSIPCKPFPTIPNPPEYLTIFIPKTTDFFCFKFINYAFKSCQKLSKARSFFMDPTIQNFFVSCAAPYGFSGHKKTWHTNCFRCYFSNF